MVKIPLNVHSSIEFTANVSVPVRGRKRYKYMKIEIYCWQFVFTSQSILWPEDYYVFPVPTSALTCFFSLPWIQTHNKHSFIPDCTAFLSCSTNKGKLTDTLHESVVKITCTEINLTFIDKSWNFSFHRCGVYFFLPSKLTKFDLLNSFNVLSST